MYTGVGVEVAGGSQGGEVDQNSFIRGCGNGEPVKENWFYLHYWPPLRPQSDRLCGKLWCTF